MTIDTRRCNMVPAFAFRGVLHQLALHRLLDRECGIFGQR